MPYIFVHFRQIFCREFSISTLNRVFYYNLLSVKTAEAPVLNEYVVITAVIQKPNICVYSVALPHRPFLPGHSLHELFTVENS